jgi:chromosome segregation ATPase
MENLYIEILKFGRNKINTEESGFSDQELTNHLKALGFRDSDFVNIQYFLDRSFFSVKSLPNFYKINIAALEHLLDQEELEEARNSSKSALRFAIVSLLVTIAVSVGAMYMSYIQINSDIKINKDQIELLSSELKNINANLKISNTQVEHLSSEVKNLSAEVKSEKSQVESKPKPITQN